MAKCSKWFKENLDSWNLEGEFVVFKDKQGGYIGEVDISALVENWTDNLVVDEDYDKE